MVENWQAGGFGLYLHWPFCEAKCPYCDFNSYVSASIDQKRWERAYIAEIRRAAAETPGRVLNTVFFGGGTPSLMSPDLVSAVLETIHDSWTVANDLEITLEANPSSVEAGRFRGYREAGVNRLSLGVQSLSDTDLRALGRLHTADQARVAIDTALTTFQRVSFDLIYARQGQTLDSWRAELKTALSVPVDHLSLYQLTIEDGTAFGDRFRRGKLGGLPTDDAAADMYFATQEICGAAGLPAYEVSNHARPSAESRHNLVYWRMGDYIGIGPGAHGRLTLGGCRYAAETPLSPADWLRQVETTESGETTRSRLGTDDQASEFLLMGLRLDEGIDLARYAGIAGAPMHPDKMVDLVDLGYLETNDGRLKVTPTGRPVLNAILRELLAG